MQHERFHYNTIDDLNQKMSELGVCLPYSDDVKILFEPFEFYGRMVNNKVVYQPMEGCDRAEDGSPGELSLRKYKRFAEGGPGTIWFEAVALVLAGRAQERQFYMNSKNLDGFKRCVETIKETCQKTNGFEPLIIMQATHSGRQSRPNGFPEPVVAYHKDIPGSNTVSNHERIVSDDELKDLEEIFVRGADLARSAGFDGYDVKACHAYLVNELLSAYNRPGEYGGSFENRTRFLRNVIRELTRTAPKDFIVSCRLSLYDSAEYPNGFGVGEKTGLEIDLGEPLLLVKLLQEECGLKILNTTIGNPYITPHINRPFDKGPYVPDEHPLVGVNRIISCIKTVQERNPMLKVVSTGLSYLRNFSPNVAAGMLRDGCTSLVGFGREALAYPDFLRDLRETGQIDKHKVCLSCSECAVLLRAGKDTGCFIRDKEIYGGIQKDE